VGEEAIVINVNCRDVTWQTAERSGIRSVSRLREVRKYSVRQREFADPAHSR
jgi:hypothetical protein